MRDRLGAAELNAFLVLLNEDIDHSDTTLRAVRDAFAPLRRQRAIGVRYQKDREELSHYVRSTLASQFDAWIHVDQTSALVPLPLATD